MTGPDLILGYWFGELTDGFSDAAHRRRWFNGGKAFDAELGDEFGHLIDAALTGELQPWLNSPRGRLAYVLVCDQLPRNIFRGERRAYATDHLALAAAHDGVEAGKDLPLDVDERHFLYMPFEHSENLIDQHTCVGLFMELRDASPTAQTERLTDSLRYARRHRDIIRRFGRFPHRNAALGRASTADEESFVVDGNNFGQSAREN
ncbi:MAG: DUF924 family protein [Pseudomonadales bacterium]